MSWWHHPRGVFALEHRTVVARPITTLISSALLDIISSRILRWRRRRSISIVPRTPTLRPAPLRTQAHAIHILSHSADLQFPHLLLEELDIPTALSHLRVEFRPDLLVLCLLTHCIGGVDKSLLALDLLVDGAERLFVGIHGCGGLERRRGRGRVVVLFGGSERSLWCGVNGRRRPFDVGRTCR